MYRNSGFQTRVSIPAASCQQFDAVGNVFHAAGSDFIRTEIGAYKEKILESGTEYFQSNVRNFIQYKLFFSLQ